MLSRDEHLSLVRLPKGNLLRAGPALRAPGEFKREALRAARELGAAHAGKKIFLLLSGGMDSEAVAECLRLAGVPFTPVVIEFEGGLNAHDVIRARDYCRRKGLKARTHRFALGPFLRSREAKRLAREYPAFPIYLVLMKALLDLHRPGRVFLTGAGEPEGVYHRGRARLVEFADDVSLFRFCRERGVNAVPFFFFWSPELYLSLLFSPPFLFFQEQRGTLYVHTRPLKEDLWQETFGIAKRRKFHGMERALGAYQESIAKLALPKKDRVLRYSWSAELKHLLGGISP